MTSVQLAHVAAGAGAGPSSTTGGAAHADVAGTPAPDPGAPRLFVIRARVQLAWTRRGVPSELQWSRRLWTLPVRGVHVAPRSPDPLPQTLSETAMSHEHDCCHIADGDQVCCEGCVGNGNGRCEHCRDE